MTDERLLQEFAKIHERFDVQDKKFSKRFAEQDKRFEKQDKRFTEQDKRFDAFEKRFNAFEKDTAKAFNALNNKIDKGIAELKQEINIIKNVNMAQILKEQTTMRKEMNKRIDGLEENINRINIGMEKNEIDHKMFNYEISRIKKWQRIAN